MKMDIDRVVAEIAPGRGPGLTPGAHELLDEITSTPATEPPAVSAPTRRWRTWLPLAAGLAATAVLLSWLVPGSLGSRPAAALDIKRQGDFYIVTVKDLYADPQRYQAQLRRLGLDIEMRVVPAIPFLVGTISHGERPDIEELKKKGMVILPPSPFKDLQGPGDCAGSTGGCRIGIKIPVNYRGKGEVTVGRAARAGEAYSIIGRLDLPGEPLHCAGFQNKTIDQVRRMLRVRGVTALSYAHEKVGQPTRPIASPPGSWRVYDGNRGTATSAILLVGSEPTTKRLFQYDMNCPKRS